MAQRTYCGNNNNYIGLLRGTHRLGTNYECLRKGIGAGSRLPYDQDYSLNYNPVDTRKFYCGNGAEVPAEYFAVGSPSKCLALGIGIGKSQKARKGPPRFMYFIRYVLPYLLFVILASIIFVSFYFTKPSFLTIKDKENQNNIDWVKFIPYYLLCCLIIAIVIYFIWTRYILQWI
jgi:hypothetical protein